ncbi:hypothetical protein V2G26_002759 [Clonostachys chloroleuca]
MSPSVSNTEHIDNGSILNPGLEGTGPVRLHNVPTFTDKHEERQWAKKHMAGAFRIFAKFGFADGASGHINLRNPLKPDCFWINPYAMHFSKIRANDLVLVNEEGHPVEPTHRKVNAAGFIIHSSIHKARPDINAACHVHAPQARAWSTFGKPIEMLNQDSFMFYDDLAVYEGFGERHSSKSWHNYMRRNNGRGCRFFLSLLRGFKITVGDEEAEYTKRCSGSPVCMYMQFLPDYNAIVEETSGTVLQ